MVSAVNWFKILKHLILTFIEWCSVYYIGYISFDNVVLYC